MLTGITTSSLVTAQERSIEPPNAPKFDSKPVYELGIGGGYFQGFDYPASKDHNNRALALPFFRYRSPSLRVKGGKVEAIAFENPRLKADLSIGGSLNADASDTGPREGMPELDFLFEIGPQIEYSIFDFPAKNDTRIRLTWNSYARAVFSTDFKSIDTQGLIYGTHLKFRYDGFAGAGTSFYTNLGPVWASNELQSYFYEVQPAYANQERSGFDAKSGYIGTELFVAASLHVTKNFRLFLGNKIGFYDRAKNRNSPLFETTRNSSLILGFV